MNFLESWTVSITCSSENIAIFLNSRVSELYANENMDWETYYRSYVDTYLQRDIRDLAQVADEMQFYNFMTIVATHTSKPVVYEEFFGIVPYHCSCAAIPQQRIETRCENAAPSLFRYRPGSLSLVICMANDLLPVDEKNWYVPVWLI